MLGFSRKQDAGASGERHPLGLLEVTAADTWGWGRQDAPAFTGASLLEENHLSEQRIERQGNGHVLIMASPAGK